MSEPRGNHVENLKGRTFTDWQRRRLRHRLLRLREFLRFRSWGNVAAELIAETEFGALLDTQSDELIKAGDEVLRRFVAGQGRTGDDRLAEIARFLIARNYLDPAELNEDTPELAPAFALASYFGNHSLPDLLSNSTASRMFRHVGDTSGKLIEVCDLELTGLADTGNARQDHETAPYVLARSTVQVYRDPKQREFSRWRDADREAHHLLTQFWSGWVSWPDPERLIVFLKNDAAQAYRILYAIGTEQDARNATVLHFLEHEPLIDDEDVFDLILNDDQLRLGRALGRALKPYHSIDRALGMNRRTAAPTEVEHATS